MTGVQTCALPIYEKSLGLLRELVAAIRSWLRTHVPMFANLRYSDDEIMREFTKYSLSMV